MMSMYLNLLSTHLHDLSITNQTCLRIYVQVYQTQHKHNEK